MHWYTKPVAQLAFMMAVMGGVVVAQTQTTSFIAKLQQKDTLTTNTLAQRTSNIDGGLVKVAAGDPTCPVGAGTPVQFASTENNKANSSDRVRIVDEPWEYDSLNTTYFSQHSAKTSTELGSLDDNINFKEDGGKNDTSGGTGGSGVTNIMSSMFRYKPVKLKDAFVLKYTSAVKRDDPSAFKGDAPAVEVPSKAGYPVCAPTTGYDIGGGYEAMIVYASSTRITLHVGIHEYMDGKGKKCADGNVCRGGYWIYISNIDTNATLLSAYQSKEAAQKAAPADISTQIQLPIVEGGRELGKAKGDGVLVAIRDSGPLIKINEPFMWGGYPEKSDFGTPVAPPAAGPVAPASGECTAKEASCRSGTIEGVCKGQGSVADNCRCKPIAGKPACETGDGYTITDAPFPSCLCAQNEGIACNNSEKYLSCLSTKPIVREKNDNIESTFWFLGNCSQYDLCKKLINVDDVILDQNSRIKFSEGATAYINTTYPLGIVAYSQWLKFSKKCDSLDFTNCYFNVLIQGSDIDFAKGKKYILFKIKDTLFSFPNPLYKKESNIPNAN